MNRLQDKRAWIVGGVLAVVVIVAAGWFMAIHPELSAAQGKRDQAASAQVAGDVLQAKVSKLRAKSRRLPQYTASLRDALETLPLDSGLPAFTRQVTAQAKQRHVDITSITVGSVAPLITTTTAPDGTTTSGTTTDAGSATPAGTDGAATVTGTGTTSSGAVWAIAVTVQSTGRLVDQEAFLNDIRLTGPRRALLTSVQLSAGDTGKVSTVDTSAGATTQLTIFFTPESAAQVAQMNKLLAGSATH